MSTMSHNTFPMFHTTTHKLFHISHMKRSDKLHFTVPWLPGFWTLKVMSVHFRWNLIRKTHFKDHYHVGMKQTKKPENLILLLLHRKLNYSFQLSNPQMKVKVTQSCLTLCNPTDCTVHGILQAKILEQVAIPFSRGSSQPRDQTQVSHTVGGFFTVWATREARSIHKRPNKLSNVTSSYNTPVDQNI